MRKTILNTIALTAVASVMSVSSVAFGGTLETMERERAKMLDITLNANIASDERSYKLQNSMTRLIDMERRVLRDDSLVGKDTPLIRQAFDNFNLTFLISASSEEQVTPIDLWLQEVGITKQAIMNASIGRR